jgi:hypothetical protein
VLLQDLERLELLQDVPLDRAAGLAVVAGPDPPVALATWNKRGCILEHKFQASAYKMMREKGVYCKRCLDISHNFFSTIRCSRG